MPVRAGSLGYSGPIVDADEPGPSAPAEPPAPWTAPLEVVDDPVLAPYHESTEDTGVLTTVPEVAPAVVAVVVAHNPGPWFAETLHALGAQTYPNLSVLVVDAASDIDPTPRVAEQLPTAYVKRLDNNPGFGAAANEVLQLVDGAAFYCLCHDDVAPDPDAIRLLVEESFRSNAGLIGPKLVEWDDPRVLQQVGVAVDKTGVLSPYADPGELDQEQHDAVRDVFAVPSGCTLVRADLFAALGGFDPAIDRHGEDLDLSWRGHVAGARVMVNPAARVRHREAGQERGSDADEARLRARHRVHTLLTCYSRTSLLRVVPQALGISLLEVIYGLFSGQSDHSRSETAAWTWNLRHWGAIRARRRALQRTRRVPDSEIRNLQTRGSARFSAFVRGQVGGGDARLRAMAKRRDTVRSFRSGARAAALIGIAVAAFILVVGSRGLLFGNLPAIGEFARFSRGPSSLVSSWFSGWRDSGLGSAGGAPAGTGVFGVLGFVFFGAMGVLRKVAILGLLPLGAVGAWRLAGPIGSTRPRVASLLVYVAIPVPYNALAQGRWSALVAWAAAPWFLLGLGRAAGIAPFGRRGLRIGDPATAATRPTRPLGSQIIGLGFGVAIAGVIAPNVFVVVVIVAVGIIVGSLLTFRVAGIPRVAAAAIGGLVVAALLHVPWLIGFAHQGSSWMALAGGRAAIGGTSSFTRILRFESGPFGAAPLGWAFLVAAALPLLIGRGWRLEWAVRCWAVALVSWGTIWAGQEGWINVALPPIEVLLAPAAVGLALAAALGVAAFEVDLPSYKFGWRQAASVVAALAVVAGLLPVVGAAFGGRWKVPGSALDDPLAYIGDKAASSSFRVLWVGDPDVMPVGSWRLDDQLSYGTSNQGLPTLSELWASPSPGASATLRDAIEVARRGDTTRLGHLLAPLGVRYIVVPSRIAPVPSWSRNEPAPAWLPVALDDQLDLLPQQSFNPAVAVWANRAWHPLPAVLPSGTIRDADGLRAAGSVDLPNQKSPVLKRSADGRAASGNVTASGQVLVDSANASGWQLTVGGTKAERHPAFGAVQRYEVDNRGSARLRYVTPLTVYGLLALQVLLWIIVFELWRRANGADRRRQAREVQVAAGNESQPDVQVDR